VADWDADSPRLRQNLIGVLRDARDRALRREVPALEDVRRWHRDAMAGLAVPDPRFLGRFRPRPNAGYGRAAEAAMRGDWRPTAAAFRRMLSRPFTSSV